MVDDEHMTAHGTPVGTSREEEKLEKLEKKGLLQRTEKGYEEIPEDEIPLSEQAGEGRVDRPS